MNSLQKLKKLLKKHKPEEILFFLVILFLPTQLGLHFWPPSAYVFSLPIDYLSPTVYFWDLFVIGWLLTYARPVLKSWQFMSVEIFLLTQLLSLWNATNIPAGLVRFEQLVIISLFGLGLSAFSHKELIQRISLPLLIALIFECLLAIAQFFWDGSLYFWILGERTFSITTPAIAKFDFFGVEFLRPYATFPHPNVLAGFVLIAVALLWRWKSFISWQPVLLALSAATVFLAFSRVAWTVGLLSFATIARQLPVRRWMWILLLLVIGPLIAVRLSSAFTYDILSFARRDDLNHAAVSLFQQNPLTGVGLNNFIPSIAYDAAIAGPTRFLQPVHNIFLLVLAETGIMGLIGWGVLIGSALWKRRYWGVWAMIFVLGMFDHYFLTLPQGLRLLFLVWAVTIVK